MKSAVPRLVSIRSSEGDGDSCSARRRTATPPAVMASEARGPSSLRRAAARKAIRKMPKA